MSEQQSLFSVTQIQDIQRPSVKTQPSLILNPKALDEWKQRVYRFQQEQMATLNQPRQKSLLLGEKDDWALSSLDPFSLPQQNTEFWRGTVSDPGVAALYFVVDAELPLLLYVGETCHSNTRWKGVHDCKRYLMNYVELHRR